MENVDHVVVQGAGAGVAVAELVGLAGEVVNGVVIVTDLLHYVGRGLFGGLFGGLFSRLLVVRLVFSGGGGGVLSGVFLSGLLIGLRVRRSGTAGYHRYDQQQYQKDGDKFLHFFLPFIFYIAI